MSLTTVFPSITAVRLAERLLDYGKQEFTCKTLCGELHQSFTLTNKMIQTFVKIGLVKKTRAWKEYHNAAFYQVDTHSPAYKTLLTLEKIGDKAKGDKYGRETA